MSIKRRLTNINVEDTISMTRFIISYCGGFDGMEVDLTHKQLKAMKPAVVKNVPFSEVTMDNIKTGKIILVRDAVGNIAPYLNPEEIRKIERLRAIKREKKEMERKNGEYKRR